ncbi:MAG: glutathione S-transferase family protein [Marinovum algicola]|uniref:glutathione S-transferase family protein n=1 Tax=Marinovum algicola TaxID=42444 RepID=UPI0032EF6BEF
MGQLVDGVWKSGDVRGATEDGNFKRTESAFRDWIRDDASARFQPEAGRYHLYVSYACPWAHRTLFFRRLKGLEGMIGVTVVDPLMLENGWQFSDDHPDTLNGAEYLHQVYTRADPDYTGKVTVPVLWDKKESTIVSNESAEIIRMFNSAFDEITGNHDDYWPEALRDEIEEVNARVYDTVNNGVYKAGFATKQKAYDAAVRPLFDTLDWLEDRLSGKRYLMGDRLTEADWRLFTTLVRFDHVYHGHFKCNRARIVDYPNLWAYTRELYQVPGVAETVNFDHIRRHYHYSHETINPHRIVPIGPDIDFNAPHGRELSVPKAA